MYTSVCVTVCLYNVNEKMRSIFVWSCGQRVERKVDCRNKGNKLSRENTDLHFVRDGGC